VKWSEDLYDLADRVIADERDAGAAAPHGDRVLWQVLMDLGWPYVDVDEVSGGVGGELADLLEIVRSCGRHHALVPLVETSLAAWVVSQAGGSVTDLGSAAVVVAGEDAAVHRVAWGGTVDHLLVLRSDACTATSVAVVPMRSVSGSGAVASGTNLAGEPWLDLQLELPSADDARLLRVPLSLNEIASRGGLLRSAAILGAVERAVDHAAQHVATRHQFGRPLVKLQAVQHLLASIISERDLLDFAVRANLVTEPAPGAAAAASATASRIANRVAAVAHQLHGAIGITQEHDLHLSTSRLVAWNDSPRSQRSWEHEVGDLIAGADDTRLWNLITNAIPADLQ
jgi:alkylation response protein AidB-like acyl-CoA dehydrogenase